MLEEAVHIASVNVFALAAATIGAFSMNFVWFTILFRRSYLAGLGKTQAQLNQGPSMVTASALQLIGFFVMALVLGWLMHRLGQVTVKGGLQIASIAWIGFVASVFAPMHAFQAYPISFTAITAGGYLGALLISGAIIGLWR